MKMHFALPLVPFLSLLGCSGAQPGSVTIRTNPSGTSISQRSSKDADKGSTGSSDSSGEVVGNPNNTPNSGNPAGGSGTAAAAYTFAEAKAFCVGCHSATSSNAAQWGKADGDEAAWRTDAALIKNSVQTGRMPRGASNFDKAKFIAFLDKLTSAGGSGGTMMPAALTFDTAKGICTSCHGPNSNNRDARNEYQMSDSNVADWRSKKNKIISEVENNSMPPGGIADAARKKAFLDFVRSL